ncbi:MAG TPA: amino acid ABC transporter substrate-binding protein [Stellaceae bacterium]|nr:amino acid ABC transporter substrate-binding protein [Stellaceae bacterium]
MRWMDGSRFCAAVLAALVLASGAAAAAAALDRIRQDKTIRIAFRDDAPPFSFKGKSAEPVGYMVDLCRAVANNLASQLNLSSLNVVYVPVTAADRFEAIAQGKADLLCEPTTQTLSRRRQVDFSIPTFVDGAGLLIRNDGPKSLMALGGHKIGVLAGTTTEDELRASLKDAGITAEVIPASTHDEGLAMLDDGKVSAYFADRGILMFLAEQSKAPAKLLLADNYLTIEPYALALPHGDEDFRLAVDRALSTIYRSGQIAPIFTHTFGAKTKPSQILQSLYLISALPE